MQKNLCNERFPLIWYKHLKKKKHKLNGKLNSELFSYKQIFCGIKGLQTRNTSLCIDFIWKIFCLCHSINESSFQLKKNSHEKWIVVKRDTSCIICVCFNSNNKKKTEERFSWNGMYPHGKSWLLISFISSLRWHQNKLASITANGKWLSSMVKTVWMRLKSNRFHKNIMHIKWVCSNSTGLFFSIWYLSFAFHKLLSRCLSLSPVSTEIHILHNQIEFLSTSICI